MLFFLQEATVDNKKKHFVFVVLWDWDREKQGVRRVLVQSGRSIDPLYEKLGSRVKFPGGGEKPEDHGNLLKTALRELEEETYLRIKLGFPPEKCVRFLCSVENKETVNSFILAFMGDFEGNLRREMKLDGMDMLKPPVFLPIDVVKWDLYHTHQAGLIEAMHIFGLMR